MTLFYLACAITQAHADLQYEYFVGNSQVVSGWPKTRKSMQVYASTGNWTSIEIDSETMLYIDEDSTGFTNAKDIIDFLKWKSDRNAEPQDGPKLLAKLLMASFPELIEAASKKQDTFTIESSEKMMLEFRKGENLHFTTHRSSTAILQKSEVPASFFKRIRNVSEYFPKPLNFAVIGFGANVSDRNKRLPLVFTKVQIEADKIDQEIKEAYDKHRSEQITQLITQYNGLTGLTYQQMLDQKYPVNQLPANYADFILSAATPILDISIKIGDQYYDLGIDATGKKGG